MMGNCAGIDWASEKHDVLIEDRADEQLLGATFSHDEDGVSALLAALECFEVEVVAIECPDGLLVDRLLNAGVAVLALHPNQVKAARDRFRASGGSRSGLISSCCVSWRVPRSCSRISVGSIASPTRRRRSSAGSAERRFRGNVQL
jgi:Transposase